MGPLGGHYVVLACRALDRRGPQGSGVNKTRDRCEQRLQVCLLSIVMLLSCTEQPYFISNSPNGVSCMMVNLTPPPPSDCTKFAGVPFHGQLCVLPVQARSPAEGGGGRGLPTVWS